MPIASSVTTQRDRSSSPRISSHRNSEAWPLQHHPGNRRCAHGEPVPCRARDSALTGVDRVCPRARPATAMTAATAAMSAARTMRVWKRRGGPNPGRRSVCSSSTGSPLQRWHVSAALRHDLWIRPEAPSRELRTFDPDELADRAEAVDQCRAPPGKTRRTLVHVTICTQCGQEHPDSATPDLRRRQRACLRRVPAEPHRLEALDRLFGQGAVAPRETERT